MMADRPSSMPSIWQPSGRSAGSRAWLLCTPRQIGKASARKPIRGRGLMDDDTLYFERRASDEFLAAAKAQHPRAREAHLKMAQRYQDLASTDALR